MEITTTTMGMVGTMGIPIRDFRHAALRSMTEREALTRWNTSKSSKGPMKAAIGMTWNDFKALLVEEFCPTYMYQYPEASIQAGSTSVDTLSPHASRGNTRFAPEIRECSRRHQPTNYLRMQHREPTKLTDRHKLVVPSCQRVMRRGRQWKRQLVMSVEAKSPSLMPCEVDLRRRDPNVVTGTFSLNDHFATVLFDSGVDFSFISTEFLSLLNVKPSIVNPGYVIEIKMWIELFSDYECEIRYHPGKAKLVRAMAMIIQSGVKGIILAAQGKAFNKENVLAKRLHSLDQQMKRKGKQSFVLYGNEYVSVRRSSDNINIG
ncbi:reverse transcriptase domain-containing protein [Tanacetum coccineum]